MDLSALVRKAAQIADRLSASLQVAVQIEPFLSLDEHVRPTYAAPVSPTPTAVVTETTRTFAQTNGDVVVATAKLTFPRNQAVNVKDRVTLPDGSFGPVLSVKKPLDPAGGGYITEAWIGKDAAS